MAEFTEAERSKALEFAGFLHNGVMLGIVTAVLLNLALDRDPRPSRANSLA